MKGDALMNNILIRPLILCLTCLGAFADLTIYFPVEDAPYCFEPTEANVELGLFPGTYYTAVLSTPYEDPGNYTFICHLDEIFSPFPIHSIALLGLMAGSLWVETIGTDFWYFPYPPPPPLRVYFPETFAHPCMVPFFENFNHFEALPPDWTVESHSAGHAQAWSPVHEDCGDWSVVAGRRYLEPCREEWLISPAIDLSGYTGEELVFESDYVHAAGRAEIKHSTNGGLTWNTDATFHATTSKSITIDISRWAEYESSVVFALVFTDESESGGSSWRIDDFQVRGEPLRAIAVSPVPGETLTDPWTSLNGKLGCTFMHPAGVMGSSVELRIDANGDGDYDDGAGEDWNSVPSLHDSRRLHVLAEADYLQPGDSLAFEFRAKNLATQLYCYSGFANTEGITDDWFVSIQTAVAHLSGDGNDLSQDRPEPNMDADASALGGPRVSDLRITVYRPDVLLSWSPVSFGELGYFPDGLIGYRVYTSESVWTGDFVFHAFVEDTTYVHLGATDSHERLFYSVTACYESRGTLDPGH